MPGQFRGRNVLADPERKAEKVRTGLLAPAEARTAEHLATPISEHVSNICDSSRSGRHVGEACLRNPPSIQTALERLPVQDSLKLVLDLVDGKLHRTAEDEMTFAPECVLDVADERWNAATPRAA
jgi:hypothetical protein